MSQKDIYAGLQKLNFDDKSIKGDFVYLNEEIFYKISDYDQMNPFLISIVSPSDHWLYISSSGGLTAGRKNPDNALFPYINDNQLHICNETTGNKTVIKIFKNNKIYLWEPFSEKYEGIYSTRKNLYKNIFSTKIIFEEINQDLGLIYEYGWTTSDRFGFVKFSRLINLNNFNLEIELLDGIQNILPSGLNLPLLTEYSTLVDGYKKNELIKETGLGLFTLSSIPSDTTQPSESLLATTVCCTGIEVDKYLLSSSQISKFRKNDFIVEENNVKGIRGAYFIDSRFTLKPNKSKDWFIVAEVNQNAASVIELNHQLKRKNLLNALLKDIQLTQNNLIHIVAKADGLQLTGDKLSSARHFSNVLFNIMRGGIFDGGYFIERDDFIEFIKKMNPFVLNAHKNFLQTLPDIILRSDLIELVKQQRDSHFTRLVLEYLPLTFSRRHGDPSRPWNKFSIEIKNNKNEKILNYQGNWRDIFQNWEALALSYPEFLESMIAKFLNNSTADGYNPYRISRYAFDWEIKEPHNPWANIGYWGDHQIIYLLKLLELSEKFSPGHLEKFLNAEIFSFANVPYRIKSYEEILKDPRNTIEFDSDLDFRLKTEESNYGGDSKFLKKHDNSLVQVSLTEKLLLTLLVKISNFIPGGGIWLNTQRPEWNDANNALVGFGVSMVTLFYIRRYVNFLRELISKSVYKEFYLSPDLISLFNNLFNTLSALKEIGNDRIEDSHRKKIVDELGTAGSEFREKIYSLGYNYNKSKLSADRIVDFLNLCVYVIDQTISVNQREDGLYNSYNILHIYNDEMKITTLYEMLEGQVAALSSGYLSTKEAINLLTSLRKSRLYREDQNSYLLYPNKELPNFLEKNNIPEELVNKSVLLLYLLSSGNEDIIYKDINNEYHFQSDLINSEALKMKLKSLSDQGIIKYTETELGVILDIYEKIFHHSQFTGRATTFYKYEGLGCIYWHMVSKLLLAVQEVYFDAESKSVERSQLDQLKRFYYDIKKGIGTFKTPSEFGAFPTDPYSHTPMFAGAQQPGMTGQVKEDIITRLRELGILIENGKIIINTSLLRREEFLENDSVFSYYDLNGSEQKIICGKNSFAITYCQVPFIFILSDKEKIFIHKNDGRKSELDDLNISEEFSQSVFARDGSISKIEILINESPLS